MFDRDKKNFAILMEETFEYYDKPNSKVKMKMYFEALKKYAISDVAEGFELHVKSPEKGHVMPRASHIIMQINLAGNQRIQDKKEYWNEQNKIERDRSFSQSNRNIDIKKVIKEAQEKSKGIPKNERIKQHNVLLQGQGYRGVLDNTSNIN